MSWTKPLLLGDEGLTPREEDALLLKTPRTPKPRKVIKLASEMTAEEAATNLQRMYRARNARRKLRLVLASVFKKMDDGQGNTYYYNTCVGCRRDCRDSPWCFVLCLI